MGRAKGGERVLGPYEEKVKGGCTRYRLHVFVKRGEELACEKPVFDTKEEAETAKAEAEAELQALADTTIRAALERFERWHQGQGHKAKSTSTAMERLWAYFAPVLEQAPRVLLRVVEKDDAGAPVTRAAQLYKELQQQTRQKTGRVYSTESHRLCLREAKRWARWCVGAGLLASDPLKGVKGEGERRAGKEQHTIDEARKWRSKAVELGAQGDVGAVAALTTLVFTLRQSEATSRRVRDLDGGGTFLRWRRVKRKKAVEHVREIPAFLRPLLAQVAAGRGPDEYLFGACPGCGACMPARRRRPCKPLEPGHPRSAKWLNRNVQRLCRLAGVRSVCAHSLRGLGATLAARRGALPQTIAEELTDHASVAVLEKHYLAPGAAEAAQQGRLLEVLEEPPEVARLRAELEAARAELAQIRALAASPPPPSTPPTTDLPN